MKRFILVAALLGVLVIPAMAQTTQAPVEDQPYQSTTEEDLRALETFLVVGRKGIPIYRKVNRLQKEMLTAVPGRDGHLHDYSDGSRGLQRFSREVQARSRGAEAGNEEDILWLEQVLLPTVERALQSGAIRELLELRDLVEQLD